MALAASGTISIGGTTADRSINLELGRTATATSNLNEVDLRTLAGIASGVISMSQFWGKSMITFFTITFGGTNTDNARAVAVDGNGNVYIAGSTRSTGSGDPEFLLAKYNSEGTIQWQRVLGGTIQDFGYGVAVDSSDNVYIAGSTCSTGADEDDSDSLLAKFPADGSRTGTYGSLVYATSTLTSATSTLTSATSTLTSATSTLTAATSTLTSATSSLTSSKTTI